MPANIFTPNMPLTPQSLGFTQPLVKDNFGNYQENMEINHLGVNSADFGKHKFLTMPQQGSAPVTGATEGGFYSAAVAGRSAMFFQRESSLAEVGISIYPGSTFASTFAVFTGVFDFSTIVDATHPNFWCMFEIRDVNATVVNSLAFVKVYKPVAGTVYGVTLIGDYANQISGGIPSFRFTGSVLEMEFQNPPAAAITPRFTITPFYFPET